MGRVTKRHGIPTRPLRVITAFAMKFADSNTGHEMDELERQQMRDAGRGHLLNDGASQLRPDEPDEIEGPFPVPCDDCGAAVGAPCMDGCPNLDPLTLRHGR